MVLVSVKARTIGEARLCNGGCTGDSLEVGEFGSVFDSILGLGGVVTDGLTIMLNYQLKE